MVGFVWWMYHHHLIKVRRRDTLIANGGPQLPYSGIIRQIK